MLGRLGKKAGRFRKRISLSEWGARHLAKPQYYRASHAVHAPGVLMIQIDGLGYDRLLQAIETKRLPFLTRLIQQDNFVLRKFYSGLPSTTPAVQGELFFGIKSGVPAFSYFNRHDRREKNMFNPEAVDDLAGKLEQNHDSLLAGGSSYSNIFAGGANEARFCIQTMKLDSIFHKVSFIKIACFVAAHVGKIIRIIGLSLLEVGLAIVDFFKGFFLRKNLFKEFKFIFSRIGTSIVLRELVRLHVKMDISHGLPIIHANFVGYDEHSHRRGPTSAFAFWTLKGIDGVIKDLVRKTVRSDKRDYRVFIYSDHGQEATRSYISQTGKTLPEGIKDAFRHGPLKDCSYAEPEGIIPYGDLLQHRRNFLWSLGKKNESASDVNKVTDNKIHITAMGPLGHIYLPFRPDAEQMQHYARCLVQDAGIPLVLYIDNDTVKYVNSSGSGDLSGKAAEVFGREHPFLQEVSKDLQIVCRHEHAGEFIISGWQPGGVSMTFAVENGSHGGPGSSETKGFVILPDTLNIDEQPYLRPLNLRHHVKGILQNNLSAPVPVVKKNNPAPEIIRVMSYNIHSCIGMDGKLFPARIARIISRQSPDIVALQEVDRHMERTGSEDQARLIAEQLDMHYAFFPVLKRGEAEYGPAVLSRFPCKIMASIFLPQMTMTKPTEKRGVLRVLLDTRHGPLHFFNTHLSIVKKERIIQMQHIVRGGMFDKVPASEPVIFCGDLNAGSNSPAYKMLSEKLSDCQNVYPHIQADPTFFSSYPLLRLDHIFHSQHLAPVSVAVINDWECRLGSDHLPVISDFIYDPVVVRKPRENHE